ncbi:hypothetical protein GCM10010885_04620 [Alicyclobacillus cellulosilyticus]|uniref:Uncharacterized protein n=2 Tax=Alicyclobacillus cellulosilyticus TaxID=1003997 RepID=A0A917K3Z8_9BACL|nr:hypothetical protein GCM10010885_04620 [Alicyclobacillus cellulosilyticus]
MRKQAWWLIGISGVFGLAVGLSNTFVNVYLWKVDRTYAAIGWYNLAVYTLLPITFVAAGQLSIRWHAGWPLRIGLALHALFYAVALAGGTQVASWPVLLGALMGTAGGFYWFAFNLLGLTLTRHGEREAFYGYHGVVTAAAGMIAPPVAGWLITAEDRLGGLAGYHVIFALSLGMFALAAFLSFQIRPEPAAARFAWEVAAGALARRPWRMVMAGCLIYGLREGVFLFLIGLLLYVTTGSEARLGRFLLLQNGLMFAAFYAFGRLIKPHRRLGFMGVGAAAMAAAALLFQLPVTPAVMVAYGCILAVVLPMFIIPLQGMVADGMDRLCPTGRDAAVHIVVREAFQNAGRVLGIALFLMMVSTRPHARIIAQLATGLGFVQLGTWVMVWAGRGKKAETTPRRPGRAGSNAMGSEPAAAGRLRGRHAELRHRP